MRLLTRMEEIVLISIEVQEVNRRAWDGIPDRAFRKPA